MATKNIKSSINNTHAARRSRYEKAETAFGQLLIGAGPTKDANIGDTMVFNIPSKELIWAKFSSSAGDSLELFNQSGLAPTWNVTGTPATIDYVISYIRGTGKAHPGLANASTEVDGEYGVQLKVTLS